MDSFGSHCSAASNFLSSQTHYYSVPFGLTAEGDCRSLGLGISQLRASIPDSVLENVLPSGGTCPLSHHTLSGCSTRIVSRVTG